MASVCLLCNDLTFISCGISLQYQAVKIFLSLSLCWVCDIIKFRYLSVDTLINFRSRILYDSYQIREFWQ